MGEHELQEALRREAQAKIRAIWEAAEAAVAARRAEVAAAAVALRAASARRQALALAEVQRTTRSQAEAAARQRLLTAESVLLERLQRLAMRLLPQLGAGERPRVWQALAGELPPGDWQRVQVHPDDLPLARTTFPAAEIAGAPELGGGLVVATADGRLAVDNSLAGRLERRWPELQIPLMAAIQEEVTKDAAGTVFTG